MIRWYLAKISQKRYIFNWFQYRYSYFEHPSASENGARSAKMACCSARRRLTSILAQNALYLASPVLISNVQQGCPSVRPSVRPTDRSTNRPAIRRWPTNRLSIWPSFPGGFQTFSRECHIGGIAWRLACWYILITFSTDYAWSRSVDFHFDVTVTVSNLRFPGTFLTMHGWI